MDPLILPDNVKHTIEDIIKDISDDEKKNLELNLNEKNIYYNHHLSSIDKLSNTILRIEAHEKISTRIRNQIEQQLVKARISVQQIENKINTVKRSIQGLLNDLQYYIQKYIENDAIKDVESITFYKKHIYINFYTYNKLFSILNPLIVAFKKAKLEKAKLEKEKLEKEKNSLTGGYHEKYLKYKYKYLQLKNKLI